MASQNSPGNSPGSDSSDGDMNLDFHGRKFFMAKISDSSSEDSDDVQSESLSSKSE